MIINLFEYKKKAAHLLTEIIENKTVPIKKYNKTVSVKKYKKTVSKKEKTSLDSFKPFVAPSVLFLLVSVIITGAFVYFYVNSHSKRKLKNYY